MDLERYADLQRQWRRSPPLQLMVQAYLGIKPEEAQQRDPQQPLSLDDERAAIQDFMRNFAAAGGVVH